MKKRKQEIFNRSPKMSNERKINIKVVINSIIAIGFLILTFTVHWMFIIGAVILMILNQRELMKKRKTSGK